MERKRAKGFWTSNEFHEFWAWKEKNGNERRGRCEARLLAFWLEAMDEYIIRKGSGLIGKLSRIDR